MKLSNILVWLLRLIAAVIMLQTLFFKFSAHPESVALFTKLGMEPWGRITTGVLELIASVFILVPRTTGIGGFLGAGLMSGAIFFHVTSLGLDFGGDYALFIYAVVAFLCCVLLLWHYRMQLLLIAKLNKRHV